MFMGGLLELVRFFGEAYRVLVVMNTYDGCKGGLCCLVYGVGVYMRCVVGLW